MKSLLIFCALIFATVMSCGLPVIIVRGQAVRRSHEVEGDWTLIYHESLGDNLSSIAAERQLANLPAGFHAMGPPPQPETWRIGNGRMGPANQKSPTGCYIYQVDPRGVKGFIDFWHVNERGEKSDTYRGIYRIKEGFLLISSNSSSEDRPDRMATRRDSPKSLIILRRGWLKLVPMPKLPEPEKGSF